MGPYFFCGIGGSGMMPLALILKGNGVEVVGSDRSHDQGRTPEKFAFLMARGVGIVPQDGQGLAPRFAGLVVSSAIEDTIPEVRRAKELGIPIIKRAELLAQLFDAAPTRIAVGGTSGKSTTTGMIAWIMSEAGLNPTVMNGANFLNFTTDDNPYASALVGSPDVFVAECDESDGSIVLYHPQIAVLTNIALDHKPVEELVPIFMQYMNNSSQVVLNITNNAVKDNFLSPLKGRAVTVAVDDRGGDTVGDTVGDIVARHLTPLPNGYRADITDTRTGKAGVMTLQVPGRHNVENALCALAASMAAGVDFDVGLRALAQFRGVARRLQTIKNVNNISVIDDFAHNPDKIAASLKTLHEYPGRLVIMFQMHGYGPFKLMKEALRDAFVAHLQPDDVLYMPDVLYMGGTADMSYTAKDFVYELHKNGIKAHHIPHRADITAAIRAEVKSGDRIVVMGARDDTLTEFAKCVI